MNMDSEEILEKLNPHSTFAKRKTLSARAKWLNKTEFLLSCMGYAIGIGSVWRFPYVCYSNGGGAFLVPYILMIFFCGIPLFLLETSMGQFASTGCISLFKISPLFKGVGYAMLVVNFIVSTYFNIVLVYPVIFLTYSFQEKLPWSNCDNPWNTKNCAVFRRNNTDLNNTNSIFQDKKTPADEFFHKNVLKISENVDDIGGIVWPVFWSNLFCWLVTYFCIIKGVKSTGKVVYLTATFPFIVLITLFVRGVTLPGAWDGIKYYIVPEWTQLANLRVWSEAATQMLFSLGPGWGGLANMASHNDFRNNGKLDAVIIPIINCSTNILAGFVAFTILGFLAHETGLPISAVVSAGPGLSYITYPEAISLLPVPQLWAVLFFLMFFSLGIDTLFVQVETIITALTDEYLQLRTIRSRMTAGVIILLAVASTIYTTNGGIYWLQIFDWYASSFSLILICLLEIIAVGWVYGIKNYKRDIEFMLQEKLSQFWIIAWKYITSLYLLFIFMTMIIFHTRAKYTDMSYPDWMISIGWCSSLTSLLCIPSYIGYRLVFVEKGSIIERIKSGLKSSNWQPADPIDTEDWKNYILGKSGLRRDPRSQQILLE